MASFKKGGGESVVDHGEASGPRENRPRGRTNTKMEAKCDASTISLQRTLKGVISQKDKASKKEERKRRKREENTKNY